jgi:hypothetical protein
MVIEFEFNHLTTQNYVQFLYQKLLTQMRTNSCNLQILPPLPRNVLCSLLRAQGNTMFYSKGCYSSAIKAKTCASYETLSPFTSQEGRMQGEIRPAWAWFRSWHLFPLRKPETYREDMCQLVVKARMTCAGKLDGFLWIKESLQFWDLIHL